VEAIRKNFFFCSREEQLLYPIRSSSDWIKPILSREAIYFTLINLNVNLLKKKKTPGVF
jgi:hypothetical protein